MFIICDSCKYLVLFIYLHIVMVNRPICLIGNLIFIDYKLFKNYSRLIC